MIRFQLRNGSEKRLTVTNPYYTNEDVMKQKATELLLKQGYTQRWISFTTTVSGLRINDIVEVGGVDYKIKSIVTSIDEKTTLFRIDAVKYD
jgi:hypothetical protein